MVVGWDSVVCCTPAAMVAWMLGATVGVETGIAVRVATGVTTNVTLWEQPKTDIKIVAPMSVRNFALSMAAKITQHHEAIHKFQTHLPRPPLTW